MAALVMVTRKDLVTAYAQWIGDGPGPEAELGREIQGQPDGEPALEGIAEAELALGAPPPPPSRRAA